jgi:pimeloyl-ACP methyl ester carboxylesterase
VTGRWRGALVGALTGLMAGALLPATAGAAPHATPGPSLTLTPCPSMAGEWCGTLAVPRSYAHPHGPQVDLAVAEHPATDPSERVGALFLNPGGPGESGVQILPVLQAELPAPVTDRFDLVTFDERGTGSSEPLRCGPPPAAAASVAPLPVRPGGPLPAATLYAHMPAACAATSPQVLPTVGTVNSARDMDRLRAALGLTRISYYGTSYGTVLGSVYARLFPGRLRGAVLDGAVVPTQPLTQQAAEEAPAAEASLVHALACTASSCPLGPGAAALYATVAQRLTRGPLPAPGGGDRFPVTLGDLDTATLFYLTTPEVLPGYRAALEAAAGGDGAPLPAISVEFQQDVNGASLVAPEWAIACQDTRSRPTARALGSLAAALHRRYPLIGAYTVSYDAGGCATWPAPGQPITALHLGAGPTLLVLGNTGDPNTPHLAAVQLTAALGRARLLTWDGWGHTWLLNGSEDPCMADAVTAYLVAGTLPVARVCR